jgi:hypothetical protein
MHTYQAQRKQECVVVHLDETGKAENVSLNEK